MLRIIGCLTLEHDLQLVLVAAIICVFGTFASTVVASRAAAGQRRGMWLALLAVCAASTVWATHFVAMLAYRSAVPMTYDAGLTAVSYLLGAVVMGVGFTVAIRHYRRRVLVLGGGATVGAGVAVLHYVGMAAMQLPGRLHYDPTLVIVSVLLSCTLGAAGLLVATRSVSHARIWSTALLVAMIVSLHFTGMGAVALEFGAPAGAGRHLGEGISRQGVAVAVTLAALVVLMIAMVGALVDRKVSHRLAVEADRFRTLADGALEGLVVHQHGVLVDANAAARRMVGFAEVDGQLSIDHWFAGVDAAQARLSRLPIDEPVECQLPSPEGVLFPAEVCRRSIRLADGADGELLAIRDLTGRKCSEARIEHLALHDPLTDLPNRRLFVELAQKAIDQAQRSGEPFALLTLDLDGFKLVNDMHGHAAGDALLKEVAQRVTATMRESDTLARFGGDEFVLLQQSAVSPSQAVALAERLLDVLGAPVRLPGIELTISASIGVALYPDDGRTTGALLRSADTAMYRAKADGKATFRFFEPQMDAALEDRRRLELRLRHALKEGSLDVVYQPLVDSANRVTLGFEALARWNDAELGVIPPSEFIPVAEATGLIGPLGELVLRRACMEAASWSRPLRVAVNLSVMQFRRKGLVDTVRRALADSGLPGHRLELEVTESLLIDNRESALQVLTELKALGVHIAMDDFGTGYSSLSYLQSFPFDKIKIDRSFISGVETEAQSASIVRAVASMGRSLNMRVVAEGVETNGQALLLKDLHCDELQGYLIARPMPAGQVEAFLRSAAELPAVPAPLSQALALLLAD
ncbi:MAG: EAL domain-containing protein [Burkholderiales bacterium]